MVLEFEKPIADLEQKLSKKWKKFGKVENIDLKVQILILWKKKF